MRSSFSVVRRSSAAWRVVAWDAQTLGDWAAIGAFFLKTETELVLKSRRVVLGRLLQHGFTFQFPTWQEAAVDLCQR